MYFISNIFLRIRGGSKSSCTNAIFFALVQELIDRPSYINEQLLDHDAYISCLQLKKVNVAHDAMHNNYLNNHTAYYHVLQQVIAFLVTIYGHGGHFGHVTSIMSSDFYFLETESFHKKFSSNRQCSF